MGVSMILAGRMRWVFLLCLLLIPALCGAVVCEPRSIQNPNGTGSRVVERVTPTGEWRYMWCPEDGGKRWRLQTWACLRKYCQEPKSIAALMWAIATEPDRLGAINKALAGGSIKPTGAQEEFEFALLLHQACTDAISPPVIVNVVAPSGWCGPVPVLAVAWVVAPNPASTTTPPTRPLWDPTGTKAVAGRATVGAVCDCTVSAVRGTSPPQTLCRVPPSAGLAYCVKP